MNNKKDSSKVYYLYGLTGKEALSLLSQNELKGLEGTKVEFEQVEDIIVLFGRLPADEYSAESIEVKVKDMNWLEKRIYEHYIVQESVMSSDVTIVPFKFCTIYKTIKKTRGFVSKKQAFFIDLLCSLKGKQEWSVKVCRDKELFKKNICTLDPKIGKQINSLENSSDGRSFLMKKKFLLDIDSFISKLTSEKTLTFLGELKAIAKGSHQNEVSTPVDKRDQEIANYSFLIQKEDLAELNLRIDNFNKLYSNAGLYAHCSGPWLPYNFVSMSGVD